MSLTKCNIKIGIIALFVFSNLNSISKNTKFLKAKTVLEIKSQTLKDNSQKLALIFGVSGQDGVLLSELLLKKGYRVYGTLRANSDRNMSFLQKLKLSYGKNFKLVCLDILDKTSILNLIKKIKPIEIYNFVAQSHVQYSFDCPEETTFCNSIGTLYILEAMRKSGFAKVTKLFQAVSSEMFGNVKEFPQIETTSFYPRSPYGVSKLYAYWICRVYRECYDMFICNGILFNHESYYRPDNFVTRKISKNIAKIHLGLSKELLIGNLDSKRDWGYAKDYVKAMWLMLQQDIADDYVIATGELHSVREFIELAFRHIGIEIEWLGCGINEVGINKKTKEVLVKVDPKYYRSFEKSNNLIGDSFKAEKKLGWKRKVLFKDLVKILIKEDLKLLKVESDCEKK